MPDGQLSFDLWGTAEADADERLAAARDAAPTTAERALAGGQFSFDLFAADRGEETEHEQVRAAGTGALESARAEPVRSP
jgi:hypothetical protein